MSLSNLFVPNKYDLYFGSLTGGNITANDITANNITFQDVTVNNLDITNDLTVGGTATISQINNGPTDLLNITGDVNITGDLTAANIDILNILTNLIPATDNTYIIGNNLKRWKDLYIIGNSYLPNILTQSGDLNITPASLITTLAGILNVTAVMNQFNIGTTNITTLTFPAPSGNITLVFPNTSDVIVGRNTTDTLTNKTLISPIINTPIIDSPAIINGGNWNGNVSIDNIAGNLILGNSSGTTDIYGSTITFHDDIILDDLTCNTLTVNNTVSSNLNPTTDNTYSLGSIGTYWSQAALRKLYVENSVPLTIGTNVNGYVNIQVATQASGSNTIVIPDPGNIVSSFVLTRGNSTIQETKTFTNAIPITATTNQLILGTTNTTTLNAVAPAASRIINFQDPGATANVIYDVSSQTLSGAKTFSSSVTITPATNQLVLSGPTRTLTLSAVQPATSSRIITFPDPGANGDVVYTVSNQTVGGLKTFSSTLRTTSQFLTFGSVPNSLSLQATVTAADANYTIPDVGTTGTFVITNSSGVPKSTQIWFGNYDFVYDNIPAGGSNIMFVTRNNGPRVRYMPYAGTVNSAIFVLDAAESATWTTGTITLQIYKNAVSQTGTNLNSALTLASFTNGSGNITDPYILVTPNFTVSQNDAIEFWANTSAGFNAITMEVMGTIYVKHNS